MAESEQATTELAAAPSGFRWRKRLLVALLAVVVAAGIAAGGFFIGQGTRQSDDEVRAVIARAVSAETERQEELRRKALDERKAKDKATLRRVVKKLKREAKQRAEQSYASGQSVGYSSGHSAGEEEGYEEGSVDGYIDGSVDGYDAGAIDSTDEVDCSDDPDVYWLPPCY